ncbi:MAG: hypothetical protein AB7O24_18665 [Kofleriaceae bacterium]
MIRVAVLGIGLAVVAACGDQVTREVTLEPTSGSRLKLEWYLFEDGTRHVARQSFYDTEMHARCAPRPYADGAVRCVPPADAAVFIDPACTRAVGRAVDPAIVEPTHFVGYDRIGGEVLPARVFEAGDLREAPEPITEYYELRDGTCDGPFGIFDDATYYDLGAIYQPVAIHETEVDGPQIASRLQVADDGMRLPVELRDRSRDAPCSPEPAGNGGVVCAPIAPAAATLFGDASCTVPIAVVDESAPTPTVATRPDPSGCAVYHAVGAPYTGSLYEARGADCRPVVVSGRRAFELDAALDLPVLERSVEQASERRLQRITLGDGDLNLVEDRLYDSAIRADCRLEVIDHTVRCLPQATTPVVTRFRPGCGLAIALAEVPRGACSEIAFAAASTELGTELRAIGAPLATPVFDLIGGQCRPYTAPSDRVLHTLGPTLGLEAFARGVRYGER